MKPYHRFLIIAAEIPVAIMVATIVPYLTHAETPSKKPAAPIVKPAEAKAAGTEPFWGITVKPSGILYTTPINPKGIQFPYSKPLSAQNRPADQTIVYPLRKGNQQGLLVLEKMRSGDCNDGMSDNRYPYRATLVINQQVLSGCGSTAMLPATSVQADKP